MREQEIYILPIVHAAHEVRCIYNRASSSYEVFIETEFAKVILCSIKAARLHSKTEIYNIVKAKAENGEFAVQDGIVKLLDAAANCVRTEKAECELGTLYRDCKGVV